MYDVQRRTYLVRHVLHKLRLLLTGLLGQQRSLLQLPRPALGLLYVLLGLVDMLADALLHLAETVLQLTYHVGATARRQWLFILTAAYLSQFACQLSQRLYEMAHDTPAAQDKQQQSDDSQWQQDVVQPVVATQHLLRRAYQGYAPLRPCQRTVQHDVLLAIYLHLHVPRMALGYLVSQCDDVRMLLRINGTEDGLLQNLRRVGMYEVVAVGSKHHTVGVCIRMLHRYGRIQLVQRQVGRDDANEAAPLVQRYTVGGYHLRTGKRAVVEVVEGVHPADAVLLSWRLVPHLIIIVIVSLSHRRHRVTRAHGVGRESVVLVRVIVGLHRYGASVDVGMQAHHPPRELQ